MNNTDNARAETTTATVEDAARAIHEMRQGYHAHEIAQALADTGLLATDRPQTTTATAYEAVQEVARLIDSCIPDRKDVYGFRHAMKAAVAMSERGLLATDRPETNEVAARALEEAADEHFRLAVAAGLGDPSAVSTWLRERANDLRTEADR